MISFSRIRKAAVAPLSLVLLSLLTSTAFAAANPHPRGTESYNLTEELKVDDSQNSRSMSNQEIAPSAAMNPTVITPNNPSSANTRMNLRPNPLNLQEIDPLDHPPAPADLGQW